MHSEPRGMRCNALRKKEEEAISDYKEEKIRFGSIRHGAFTMNKAISNYKEEKIRFGSIRHGAFTMNKAISDYKEEKIWVGSARGPYDV